MAIDDALNTFRQLYGTRYVLGARLGEGASGVTFLARDLLRSIDVCLKFFLNSSASAGAARDWYITSTMKHQSIADTFTIEALDRGDANHVVVVSRYIPGAPLADVLNNFDASPETDQGEQRAALLTVLSDVCGAVAACHESGHGHGDLHERNVIVTARGVELGAVVIDFDNATIADAGATEAEHKAKDLRSLRRIAGMITYGWTWHDRLQELLDGHDTINAFTEALGWGRRLFEAADRHARQPLNEHQLCEALYDHNFTLGFAPEQAKKMMRSIEAVVGTLQLDTLWASAKTNWRKRTRNQFSFRVVDDGEKPQLPDQLARLLRKPSETIE
jgi:serine/threonine protein kinase